MQKESEIWRQIASNLQGYENELSFVVQWDGVDDSKAWMNYEEMLRIQVIKDLPIIRKAARQYI